MYAIFSSLVEKIQLYNQKQNLLTLLRHTLHSLLLHSHFSSFIYLYTGLWTPRKRLWSTDAFFLFVGIGSIGVDQQEFLWNPVMQNSYRHDANHILSCLHHLLPYAIYADFTKAEAGVLLTHVPPSRHKNLGSTSSIDSTQIGV